MTTLREAAQQALEALEEYQSKGAPFLACDGAVAALRAALAQQAEPVEPVAHRVVAGALFDFMGWLTCRRERLVLSSTDDAAPAAAAIKDFAEMRGLSLDDAKVQDWDAAPPQRKPLTEKEMYAVEEEARKNFRLSQKGPRGQQITYWDGLTPWLIRAVERAHGIKE